MAQKNVSIKLERFSQGDNFPKQTSGDKKLRQISLPFYLDGYETSTAAIQRCYNEDETRMMMIMMMMIMSMIMRRMRMRMMMTEIIFFCFQFDT